VDRFEVIVLAGVVVVLLSSTWVYCDARKHRIPTHGYAYTANTGAGAWLIGCLFLWIVVFPAYLIRRGSLLEQRRQRAQGLAEYDQRASNAVELVADEPALDGSDPWDLVAIGQCQRLRGLEAASLAPEIPGKLIQQALKLYLRLEPGELLLAIIDPTLGKRLGQACALTTRQIHWSDPNWRDTLARRADQGLAPGLGLGRAGLAFTGVSIPYTALGGLFAAPQPPGSEVSADPASGPVAPSSSAMVLELGDGRKIDLEVLEPGLRDAVCEYLHAVGPAARQGPPMLGAEMANQARWMLPSLKRQSARLRAETEGVRDFQVVLKSAIRRAWVTPSLVVTCVAVFVAMVLQGVSPVEPSIEDLLKWGANFGPYVAVDREYWRLVSSVFLHIGFLHLFFNMWCLLAAGPMIERFFGHLGFAAIYILSGLGGAVASMAVHPTLVSAGASGAIFGIFGALLGFLVVQHHAVPSTLLKLLRSSAGSFVAYNIFFGLMSAKVDNAAHLGGLATGFVCGLLLHRRLSVVAGGQGIMRRLVATSGMMAALVAAALALSNTIAANPQLRLGSHGNDRLAESYNQLARDIEKPCQSFDQISQEMNRLLDRLSKTDRVEPADPALLGRLVAQADTDLDTVGRIQVDEPELKPVRDALLSSLRDLRDALKLLRQGLGQRDPVVEGTIQLFDRKLSASNRATEEFVSRRDKFLRDHRFTLQPARTPGPPGPPGDNRLP
jgi:rhomboid protease GluP